MSKIILLSLLLFAILYLLKKKTNASIYSKLIFLLPILVVLFLIATSGKIILPQILQIIKIGLPLITKFVGF